MYPEYSTEQSVRELLPIELSRPSVLERDIGLPFHLLNPTEFEVFCWLLIKKEGNHNAVLYGGSNDQGRDIVFTRSDSKTEFVQCKRYGDKISKAQVLEEIAKACFHQYQGRIPQKCDRIVFYLADDLSNSAKDLVQSQNEWVAQSEKALRKMAGADFCKELVEYAKTWWPEIEHQTGIELTQRAKNFPKLIEEFFAQEKVITGDAADIISCVTDGNASIEKGQAEIISHVVDENIFIKKALAGLSSQISSLQTSSSETIESIIKEAHDANPHLSIKISADFESIAFIVNPKKGISGYNAGSITFPKTEAGQQGFKKITNVMETGRSETLNPGEYVWESSFKPPLPSGFISEQGFLTIEPSSLPKSIAVALKAVRNGIEESQISFTNLSFERVGSKEIEIRIVGGQFSGRLIGVLPRCDEVLGTVNYSFELTDYSAEISLKTLKFFRALASGASLQIWSLELDDSLFTFSSELSSDGLDGSIQLLEYLILINQTFGLKLRHPERWLEEDAQTVELLGQGILNGIVDRSSENLLVTVGIQLNQIEAFMMSGRLRFEPIYEFRVFGVFIWVGPIGVVLEDFSFVNPVSSFRKEDANENGFYQVQLQAKKIFWDFADYLPTTH